MSARRFRPLLAPALLLLASASAGVTPGPATHDLDIPLGESGRAATVGAADAARALERRAAQRFGADWRILEWHAPSGAPASMVGPGIDLAPTGLADDAHAEAIARDFIAANPDLFGAGPGDLALDRIVRGAGKVAIHFAQRHHGVPVIGGRARLLCTESGRLAFLGSTLFPGIDVQPVPLVGATLAAAIARDHLPFDPARVSAVGDPELAVLPVAGGARETYRLVWRVRIRTHDPVGIWITDVDAHDAAIVQRSNEVERLYGGTSQGDVDITSYCDGATPETPFAGMTVSVSGVGADTTDVDGGFSIPGDLGPRTATAEFNGPHVDVERDDAADALFSGAIMPGLPLAITWTDASSHRAERDAFYWVNAIVAFLEGVDGAWSGPKMTARVNLPFTCGAHWADSTLSFSSESAVCANTGTMADVIAHEYGHGVQHGLLGQQGPEGLGNGNADILSTFMVDDSLIGRGFFINDCVQGLRDCDNDLVYPDDVVGESHADGRIVCAVNWDVRLALESSLGGAAGKAHAARLWHFARKLLQPLSQPDQMLAYFLIDDDDGDLTNGTPHYDEILVGCERHFNPPEDYCPQVLPAAVGDRAPAAPAAGAIHAQPSPFRTRTRVAYGVASTGRVSVAVYDVAGRLVRSLVERELRAAGSYTVDWDGTGATGRRLPPAAYLLELRRDGRSIGSRKVVLLP